MTTQRPDAMPAAPTKVILVQHAEKETTSGDPGLSEAGRQRALDLAERFRSLRVSHVLSSPMRRAQETAWPIAASLGLPLELDDRLRERMNWGNVPGQPFEEFLADWEHATRDRDFAPRSGESSRAAGARLLSLLDELHELHPGETVLAVTHGGVTWDLFRTLFGDGFLPENAALLAVSGMPSGAITPLERTADGWRPVPETEPGRIRSGRP